MQKVEGSSPFSRFQESPAHSRVLSFSEASRGGYVKRMEAPWKPLCAQASLCRALSFSLVVVSGVGEVFLYLLSIQRFVSNRRSNTWRFERLDGARNRQVLASMPPRNEVSARRRAPTRCPRPDELIAPSGATPADASDTKQAPVGVSMPFRGSVRLGPLVWSERDERIRGKALARRRRS